MRWAVRTVDTPGVTDVEVLVKEIERREQQILDLKEGHVKEIEHLEPGAADPQFKRRELG